MASSTEMVPAGGGAMVEREEETKGGSQYLTFTLGGEEYGVDILRVQEIKGWTPVTRIPKAPDYIRGVLNLRGAIVPVVDLRMRFGLENVEYTPTTVVIVLSVKRRSGKMMIIGIVVDGVSDVLSVAPDSIRPAPDFGTVVDTHFVEGLVAAEEGMVMLLAIDALLSVDELQAIETLDTDEDDSAASES